MHSLKTLFWLNYSVFKYKYIKNTTLKIRNKTTKNQ